MSFARRYGPAALVTGASRGIGKAFALEIARRRLDLVLVADGAEELATVGRDVEEMHGVEVSEMTVDLASPDALDVLRDGTRDLDVGLLVLNAGVSLVGRFLDQDLDEKMHVLDLNARSTLVLAHEYGRRMRDRGRGGIIVVSSLAAVAGSDLVATYAATKAFCRILGETLWEELREHGVDVLSLLAGPTRTPGWESSGPRAGGPLAPRVMEPGAVARHALDALGAGPCTVAGGLGRLGALVTGRLLPRSVATRVVGRSIRSLYPDRR